MALSNTTLSSAAGANDVTVKVASATGAGRNKWLRIGDEMLLQSADADSASPTIIPVLRGQDGTQAVAHVSGENVSFGDGTDFTGTATATATNYPLAGRQRRVVNYAASGAITLPSPGTDMVAVLIGTGTLAMTVASPTKDMDGCLLMIQGNAKSASTVTVNDGTTGVGNAGSGYDVITFQNAGNVGVLLIAINGFWNIFAAPAITGTTTAIGVAIA